MPTCCGVPEPRCCHDDVRYTKVGLLRKLLRETSRERAEWILWLDADTLLEEMAFQLPMSAYDGKNFIAWGNADYLWAGDQFHGSCVSEASCCLCLTGLSQG